mmetsp:Transcript_22310/g.35555  ORF Transcript_22310/g.35555 Transcript_22310/m.35555 type:complete len:444 (+) Transcript_22310:619-1950(+)
MGFLHIDGLGGDKLRIEPRGLCPIRRGGFQEGPGPNVLIANLLTGFPIGAMRAGGHPPQWVAFGVHGVIAFRLRLDHVGGKGGIPEDLLGHVALGQCRQGLVEVVRRRTGGCIGAQPFVPFADRVDRCWTVGGTTAGDRCASRVTGAFFHADAPFVDWHTVWFTFGARASHRQPCVGHTPAKVRRAFTVVHVTVDIDAVDVLHVFGEEFSNVFIGGPVYRHAKVIAIFGFEGVLQIGAVKPVFAEPVEVRELLVWKLIQITVRPGGELGSHKVIQIEGRGGACRPVACHLVAQVVGQLQTGVCPDQVGVVDVAVIEVPLGLHLCLYSLHHFALAEDLVVDLDAGDFFKGLGQNFGLVTVGRNALRQHVDFHARVGLRSGDKPLHFAHLLVFGQRRRLELCVDPALGCRFVGIKRICTRNHGRCRNCGDKILTHLVLPIVCRPA